MFKRPFIHFTHKLRRPFSHVPQNEDKNPLTFTFPLGKPPFSMSRNTSLFKRVLRDIPKVSCEDSLQGLVLRTVYYKYVRNEVKFRDSLSVVSRK